MPAVKPHNNTRQTRRNPLPRNNDKNIQGQQKLQLQKKNNKKNNKNSQVSDSQFDKSYKSCGNCSSDTQFSDGQSQIHTNLANRRGTGAKNKAIERDTKKTIKKLLNLDSKPIMKQLNKRLKKYSVQYTPEYFQSVLQYLVEKQKKKSMAITQQKLKKWRIYRQNENQIQRQLKKEVNRIKNIFISQKSSNISSNTSGLSRISQSVKEQSQNNSEANRYIEKKYHENSSISSNFDNSLSSNGSNFQKIETSQYWQNQNRFNKFATIINQLLDVCSQSELNNSFVPACYYFYMLLASDSKTFEIIGLNNQFSTYRSQRQALKIQESIEYYFVVAIFISSKYHEIYPCSAYQLIQEINQSLSLRKTEKIEAMVLQMTQFSEFYTDNQFRFLQLLLMVIGWGNSQKNICEFILESGLNNPKLYKYSPLYKAIAVIGIYEERYHGTSNSTCYNTLKNIFQGPSPALGKEIKRQYYIIMEYNVVNGLNIQRKKHFIFAEERKKLIGNPTK